MNPGSSQSRRSGCVRGVPVTSCLILGIGATVVLFAVVWGLWISQQQSQIEALQTELGALRGELEATKAGSVAIQNTVVSLENRLSSLESVSGSAAEMAGEQEQVPLLQASLAEMQIEVADLQAELDGLDARMETLHAAENEAARALPQEVHLSVARQRQGHNLSCESSAASMAAQYQGVPLSEAEVLAALPLNDNPHLGFRGNVDGPTGGIEDYGIYAGPILRVLNDRGLHAVLVQSGLEGVRAALARGNPVLAWVTYNCQSQTPITISIDGQQVTLVPFQHVVVVTGYNAQGFWANDPWDGQEDFYSLADFERAMGYFDDMAVEVAVP
ncbi:MAG: C39 family peptidase [Anaerolineae bacterium]|jgi:uncharacterized protein YvpB